MVYKCCVPLCRGNYDNKTKVHVFRFPKDVELKRKWLSAIRRIDFKSTENSRKLDDEKAIFLYRFLDWLDSWKVMYLDSGFLSRETFSALKHTTHALLEVSSYCFTELEMNYILLGKFQTDCLESRFGLYRQLAGSQYNISARQVYEAEQKLRMSKVMQNQLKNTLCKEPLNGVQEVTMQASLGQFHDLTVTTNDLAEIDDDLPIVVFVSGYCVFSVIKKLKCDSCRENLLTCKQLDISSMQFTASLDRGGLNYPQQHVVELVMYNYTVVKKLTNSEYLKIFLEHDNQRAVVINVTKVALENN